MFDLDTVFDAFVRGTAPTVRRAPVARARPLTLREEDGAYVLTVEVPGSTPDDVTLDVTRDGLSFEVQRNVTVPDGFQPVRRERRPFRLSRTFKAPVALDPDGAEANLANGVLTIRLTKAAQAQPRRLAVNA